MLNQNKFVQEGFDLKLDINAFLYEVRKTILIEMRPRKDRLENFVKQHSYMPPNSHMAAQSTRLNDFNRRFNKFS